MSGQQPCLPVPRKRQRKANEEEVNVNNFDDLAELDATAYLSRVVEQARQIPEIMIESSVSAEHHPLDVAVGRQHHGSHHEEVIDGSAACVQYLVSNRTVLLPPPSAAYTASSSWVEESLQLFSNLHTYLSTCRESYNLGTARRIPVPPLKEQTSWHIFCVGTDDAQGNAGAYFHDDDDDDESSTTDAVVPLWKQQLPPAGFHTPTVELLCQLDQVAVRKVLRHLVHFVVEGWSPTTPNRSAWLYALLARMDRHPLHREEAALLRQLLRALSQWRGKRLDPSNREEIARVNLLLVIVGIYFDQCKGYDEIMNVKTENA